MNTLIHSQQLVKARPMLQRLRKNPDVDVKMHATMDFYVALSYVFEYFDASNTGALDNALKGFDAFIKAYPNNTLVPSARYNIGDIHAISKRFKEALQTYIPLYTNPVPGVERKEVLKKIILIYIAEKQWSAGLPYFEAGMRSAESSVDRTTYAAYMLIAKAKQGDVSESRQMLEFFSSPAPVFYTPRFNTSLMDVGDQLREEGDLATASLFYQFVRSYESLQVGLRNHIRHLEKKVKRFEGNIVLRKFYVDTKTELDNATADLAALEASQNYTPLLNWRIASIYMDMGRNWAAFWRFRVMVDTYPDHEYAEDILFAAFSLGRKLGEFVESEDLSKRYLGNEKFTRYRGTVSDEITTDYLELEKYDKLYEMTRWYMGMAPNDPAASLLLFKCGMARLSRFETLELIDDFQGYKDQYDDTRSALVINYFLGLGHLTEQHNQKALVLFEEVIQNQNTRFRADASFRKALCVMGLDRIVEARDLLLEFVERYPDNPLRAQAELVLGNLVDMLGDANAALEHFYLIEKYTDDLGIRATGELKISRIWVDRGEVDESIDRLTAFIQTNEESPETIPVVSALANIYDELGQPRVALATIEKPLYRFFEITEDEQLDDLIIDYLKKDRSLREMRQNTKAFLNAVATTPDLLKELIGDRGKQYHYFKENPNLDALVKQRFVKDNEFRAVIIDHFKTFDDTHAKLVKKQSIENPEAPAPIQKPYPIVELAVLQELKAEIEALNASIPDLTADTWLNNQLTEAKVAENVPLVVRILTALAITQTPAGVPDTEMLALVDNEDLWPQIGLAGKLWILKEYVKSNPQGVIDFIEASRVDYMNSSAELGITKLLAETYQNVDRIQDAIDSYKTLIKRFAAADESGDAAIRIGRMEIARGNYAEAREELEMILHHNEWRGQRHGDALLWIGRAYVAEGKLSDAHGFYERIMLGYPGFNELLATAYYEDVTTLKAMGEPESARTVFEAFKLTPGLEDTKAAALIRKEFE
ncbi:tetratricopeptide repeat protein [Puniceicoccaceae bacterium]|nr:tetratricopeptide repeat protein [Puniceicoccaceae bacterium]